MPTRREFLQMVTLAAAGVALEACAPKKSSGLDIKAYALPVIKEGLRDEFENIGPGAVAVYELKSVTPSAEIGFAWVEDKDPKRNLQVTFRDADNKFIVPKEYLPKVRIMADLSVQAVNVVVDPGTIQDGTAFQTIVFKDGIFDLSDQKSLPQKVVEALQDNGTIKSMYLENPYRDNPTGIPRAVISGEQLVAGNLWSGIRSMFESAFGGLIIGGVVSADELETIKTATSMATAVPTKTLEATATAMPTRQPTEVPSPTAKPTPEATKIKEGVLIETINVGETAIGSPIDLKIYSQGEASSDPIIWIMGGIHQIEMTGWNGYLTKMSEWLKNHQEEWKDLRFALGDVNPDGQGRVNPNGVNIMRNADFAWEKTDEKTSCSADGAFAESEPETKAIMNAGRVLQEMGEVKFMVDFHGTGAAIDPSHCVGGSDDLSCSLSIKLADVLKYAYVEKWNFYLCFEGPEGLRGQPDDALAVEYGIPGCTLEVPDGGTMTENIDWICRGLIKVMKG